MMDSEPKILEEQNRKLKAELRTVQKELRSYKNSTEKERKQWEKNSPSRELLGFTLSHMPLVLWCTNCEGQVSQLQGAGLEQLGLAGGEVYGQSLVELFDGNSELAEAMQRAMGGEAFSQRISLEQHDFDCRFSPQRNAEQDVIGVRGVGLVLASTNSSGQPNQPSTENESAVGNPVPKQHSMANRLNEQEGPLQTVLRCLPDFVLSIDRCGTIRFINRTIPPLKSQDVIGSSIYDFVAPEHQDEVRVFMKQAFSTGENIDYSIDSHDPDGVTRTYACRLGPYKPAGEVLSVMMIAQDVTDLRRAEDLARKRENELEHLSRVATMGEMASIVAHYLNNPLAAISNYAHGCVRRLKSGDFDVERFMDAQSEIVDQCNRASDYIRQLRGFLQKREMRRVETNLEEVIADALRLIDPEVRAHGVIIKTELIEANPRVYADALQIEQVLVNLLLNAVDAMKPLVHEKPLLLQGRRGTAPERKIVIRVEESPQGDITVTVQDTGRGLTAGFEERIFEPFFTTREKHLGMGLSVSKSIVESHGGRLVILPQSESGTTFRFNLTRCSTGQIDE